MSTEPKLVLTAAEIRDLEMFAEWCEDDTEIAIVDAPPDGVDGIRTRFVAYYVEYPDEGCIPMGEQLKAKEG
jgi:hypothetical protein